MPPIDEPKSVLPYQPAPPASHPPLFTRVGCWSSFVGALLFGLALPYAYFEYVTTVYNDAGGILFWPLLMFVGTLFGTFIVPLLVRWLYQISKND